MSTSDIVVGIDIGTNSTKGVACQTNGEIVAEARVDYRPSVPRPGWMEHDADSIWWRGFCSVSRQLIEKAVIVKKVVALTELIMPAPEQGSGPLENVWRDSA